MSGTADLTDWVEQLGAQEFEARLRAGAHLCGWGDHTRDVLITALAHPGDRVRAGSVNLLSEIGDARHLDAVCDLLQDPSVRVRRAALHGLHKLSADPAVPAAVVTEAYVSVAAQDASLPLRRTAAHALGSRPACASARAALEDLLTVADVRLKTIAGWSLTQQTRAVSLPAPVAPTSAGPTPPLTAFSTGDLVALLGHDLPRVRAEAGYVLFARGADALPDLQAGMQHADVRIRRACVDLMDHLADDSCLPPLVEALRDEYAGVRRGALHSLTCQVCKPSPLQGDRLAPVIERALTDPDRRVRQVATGALADFADDPRARQALETLVAQEKDAVTRKRALSALK